MQIVKDPTGSILALSGGLNIGAAEQLRTAVIEAFQAHPGITLDLDAVEACDTAGLQMLCAIENWARQTGRSVQVSNIPVPVAKLSVRLGIPAKAEETEREQ